MLRSITGLLAALACATTLFALTTADAVKINEIYFAGSPGLADDGFVELFNAGADTAYLDGALLIQGLDTLGQLAYRFPGPSGGRDLPLAPGQFLIFAIDAFNFMEEYPASVNLSNADFESAAAWETPPGDNPAVPDLTDILEIGFDWFFYPAWGQVLLTTGAEWTVRPCEPGEVCGNVACIVPLATIVDGIEYLQSRGDTLPRLNDAIDAGAILGVEPFSGVSAERRAPGWDTGNSTEDFVILPHPTPGFSAALHSDGRRDRELAQDPFLLDIHPNPFNSEAWIRFNLDVGQRVELSVLNVLGQPVEILYRGFLEPGHHQLSWNGSARGQNLPSGIYFIRLAVQKQQVVAKLVLAR